VADGCDVSTRLMTDRKDLPIRYVARLVVVFSLALLAVLLGVTLANVFASSPGSLVQQGAKLTGGPEASGEGRFGHSVAVSGDGTTVLVGSPDDDGELGAAWVFERSGSTWTQPGTKLAGGEEELGEGHFGADVALSADGNTALVGAPRDDGGLGAVWVLTRSGSTWTRQEKLTGGAEESASGGWFGDSVALSADGATALVGAPVDHGDTGAVWVFARSGSTWTRQAKLTGGAEESADGWFGGSMALSGDGATALVGDPADDGRLGAVWVFARSGSTWTQQGAKLTGGEEESGEGRFGSSVSMSADGGTALVGGRSDGTGSGAAWAFTRSGTGWTQQGAKLIGGEEVSGEAAGSEAGSGEEERGEESGQGRFGGSVALSAEGNTALVGVRNDGTGRGAVLVFTRSGSTWKRQGAKLTGAEEAGKGQFGYSVALSADAQTAVIGGFADHGKAGAAWIFAQLPSVEPPLVSPQQPTFPTAPGQSFPSSSTSSSPSTEVLPKLGVKSFKSTSGHVQLVSATIPVRRGGRARIELRCVSAVACRGTLKLTILSGGGRGGKRIRTIRLGASSFALRAGRTSIVGLVLNVAASARLQTAHGRMGMRASLRIAVRTPHPQTQIHAVRLVRRQARVRS
jgi:FG-GAP repeat